ncbi:hypothetical protein PPL_03093 [Heterostelium album PN500]|uniref:DDE Tnp4 domain-containing protein n=1 Tax=Heterostelium pallidum (strain ATCC 26659 / Pp 5 / PN500) TaxID=670386 RepID=D3B3X2_HETP5|nr:hypothetical protein PPL_03093 [Heterostelium album PN500]EFA84020.1 hypothetical protein PPL_03093 [Heterostelium album PN500]|eukprot:XP_020436137.1 hypothetical protein PPL_03093 [Heterostelium album PN500]
MNYSEKFIYKDSEVHFRSDYGCSPETANILFEMLSPHGVKMDWLLWMLQDLVCFEKIEQPNIKRSFGKQFSIDKFKHLSSNSRRFKKNKTETLNDNVYAYLALDTTLCPVPAPDYHDPDNKLLYSKKHATHGFKYEVAIGLQDGLAYRVYGPCMGSKHDYSILADSGIIEELEDTEAIIADLGYVGEEYNGYILTSCKDTGDLSKEEKLWNLYICSNRAIVENFFSRLKIFKIVSQTFRADFEKHIQVFSICVWLTNRNISESPLR